MSIPVEGIIDQGLLYRSRAAAAEYRRGGLNAGRKPVQAVFKVIGSRGSRAGVRDLVAYVTRSGARAVQYNLGRSEGLWAGPAAPLSLQDEAGEPYAGGHADLARDWDLPDDHDLAWRKMRLEASAPGLERRERALVWHLTVSAYSETGWAGDERPARDRTLALLEEAVRGFVFEAFAGQGWPAFWVIHHDGAQPHAHIVLRAENIFGERIRFDKQGEAIDGFREIFTRHARECGIDLVAERREDRAELRPAILEGREAVRPDVPMVEKKLGHRDILLQAPSWYQAEGEGYERRRRRDAERRVGAAGEATVAGRRQAYIDSLPVIDEQLPARKRIALAEDMLGQEGMVALFAHVRAGFVDPAQALRSYLRMATEGAHREPPSEAWPEGRVKCPRKTIADWYMRNQPIAFGDIGRAALTWRRDATLQDILRKVRPTARYEAIAADPARLRAARLQADSARGVTAILRNRELAVSSLSRLADRTEELLQLPGRAAQIRKVVADIVRHPVPGLDPRSIQHGMQAPPARETEAPVSEAPARQEQGRAQDHALPKRGLLDRILRRGSDRDRD